VPRHIRDGRQTSSLLPSPRDRSHTV
jgi:hypothetical protein